MTPTGVAITPPVKKGRHLWRPFFTFIVWSEDPDG